MVLQKPCLHTFGISKHPHLRVLGTEQVRQLLRTALPVYLLRERGPGMGHMFYSLFVELSCSLSYILAEPYLQLVVPSGRRKVCGASLKLVTAPSTVVELLCFHALRFEKTKCQKHRVHLTVLYKIGTRLAFATQGSFKA